MRRYGILLLALLAVGGCAKHAAKNDPHGNVGVSVTTGIARVGDISSVVEVSGDIKALKMTALSAKVSGRVVSVPFREGDHVSAGATVVLQDTSDSRAQVQQAEAGLASARARLSQATTQAAVSGTQIEAQVAQSRAALDAAKANLRMLKNGPRAQERAQAQNAVDSAKANYENAKADLDRMRDLYNQGALSPKQWDSVQTTYRIAQAAYDSAKQALSMMEAGTREEQLDAASKQVAQAEEGLRMAEANRSQKALRLEDVKAAKAGVSQAKAALAYAQQQLDNDYIRTPIAGTVSSRMTEPGQMASPGAPLIQVVALDSVYFEATASEIDVDKVKVGQPVQLAVDALPGRRFVGTVQKIFPTADTKSRQFYLRITVLNKGGELRPGMFARGHIEVARHTNVVIIPKDALIQNGEAQAVYVVVGDTAKLVPVLTRFETRTEAEAVGVSAGDRLVTSGQDVLSHGVKVNVAD